MATFFSPENRPFLRSSHRNTMGTTEKNDEKDDEHDEWEVENPDRVGRMSHRQVCQARLDLFAHTDILDELAFDDASAEHKLPNVHRRTAEQTVPVTSVFPDYDGPETQDFFVTCKIADPLDAAILLNAKEPDVVLQALEALIAFVEDRLGQFRVG